MTAWCVRVRPESSHLRWPGPRQIITRGRSGCLAPASASRAWSQSPAPAPGNQYLCRHWPVSGHSGQGWTESVEWSEGSGQHPATAVYRDLVSSSPQSRQRRSHQPRSSRPRLFKSTSQDAPEIARWTVALPGHWPQQSCQSRSRAAHFRI